jgi:allophanate hydrolase
MTDTAPAPARPQDLPTAGATLAAVRAGTTDVAAEARAARDRAAAQDDASYLHVLGDAALDALAARATAAGPQAPLAGLTFAVKDNIDVAGAPTTAACPSYAFEPERSATVVEQLVAAGAVPVGKTNLDQFATGLVGTRSPHGAPRSVADPDRISGGSSSGSAVAVARGDVHFALGTDTAGSGRVPAGFNGIVGLKPTRGRLSTAGVVPACRSLDCVSIFARDVDTAATVLDALDQGTPPAAFPDGPTDPRDAYSRGRPGGPNAAAARSGTRPGAGAATWRVGVDRGALEADGDDQTRAAWSAALAALELLDGVELVDVDIEPFVRTGALLYEGPWVAERYAAVGAFLETAPADADPTVSSIVLGGREPRAVAAFEAAYRLQEARASTRAVLAGVDALLAPTAPIHPTVAEVAADPVAVNSRLGRFTNFVNLLDLCALAVPGPQRPDGLPFGVTLIAPAWHDELLLELGAGWERALRGDAVRPEPTAPDGGGRIEVVVAGAHMAGLPANPQLLGRDARFDRLTRTAAGHGVRVVETPLGVRPGLARPVAGSAAPEGAAGQVEVEVWSLDAARLGSLAGEVPEGLALGPVALLDGTRRLGFVAAAVDPAAPSEPLPGGWRAHVRAAG